MSSHFSETGSYDDNRSRAVLAKLLLLSVDDENIAESSSFQSPDNLFVRNSSPTNTCSFSTFSELKDEHFSKQEYYQSNPNSCNFMSAPASCDCITDIIKTELGKAYSADNFDANVNLFHSRYYRRNKKHEKLLVRVKELEAIINDISSDKNAIELELLETRNQLDLLVRYMEKANNIPRMAD